MKETIFSSGKLFELVHTQQPDGRVFEMARRAPGVRLIIADMEEKKVLLTKEFRTELSTYDFRLPGGKVFDTLQDYETFRQTGEDILRPASSKAKAEAREEAGIAVGDVKFYKKSTLGATVEWDLYVFAATNWDSDESGQALEEGEIVDDVSLYDFETVRKMILRGEMQEERIALILLQWLAEQGVE